ncbi:MAG: hypothetical protein ACO3A2_05190 [Bdellovibrionia bacterium]
MPTLRETINGWNQKEKFNIVLTFLLGLFCLFSLRYQYHLLNFQEWGDESETIVCVKMMHHGMRLYSEIFNHHGPLTFLPGLIAEKITNCGIQGHRLFIAILQILAVLSIYNSPIIETKRLRLIASTFSVAAIIFFMPKIFGHMYKYQTIAGIFLTIIISNFSLPSIYNQNVLRKNSIFMGNFLLASLPFLSITYLPTSGLIFLASFRQAWILPSAIGLCSGLLVNLAFLAKFGSLAGYLAFHIYLNSKLLPLYTGLKPGWDLVITALNTVLSDSSTRTSFLVLLRALYVLGRNNSRFYWRPIFLVIALLSLLMRGGGFHGMPFFYSVLPFFAPFFKFLETDSSLFRIAIFGVLSFFTVQASLILPKKRQLLSNGKILMDTEFSQLVKKITEPEDRIISYPFNNFEYLASDRLPASGHFFYLPWQEKYNENPQFGVMINACQQIQEAAPKVIWIDQGLFWGRFPWRSYATCIQNYVDLNYQQVPEKPYYIRKDLLKNNQVRSLIFKN